MKPLDFKRLNKQGKWVLIGLIWLSILLTNVRQAQIIIFITYDAICFDLLKVINKPSNRSSQQMLCTC
jgi:hypothetical protein